METQNTPRNFALQLGALVSLYVSVGFIVTLAFSIINLVVPDAKDQTWQVVQANETIKLAIAMVIVFFPTYLVLTRFLNKVRRTEVTGAYIVLTKWLIYLSILLGGAILLGDLVSVIYNFLNGELTTRFLLKALSLLVIIGLALWYYILDLRHFWITHEKESLLVGGFATFIVCTLVVFGFMQIESPSVTREKALDSKQVDAARQIQWAVEDYYRVEKTLPQSLDDLQGRQQPLPVSVAGREDLTYEVTDEGFKLCTTFAYPTSDPWQTEVQPVYYYDEKAFITNPDNWYHEAGYYCFERVVKLSELE
jgi:hypothetical protein